MDIYKRPVNDLNLDTLSADQLFVIGYLMAMDNYFNTTTAAEILHKASEKIGDSQTISLINAIVRSQELLTDGDRWPEIWELTTKVLEDKTLKEEMRSEAVKIITDYMVTYKEGTSEGSFRTYDYLKIVKLIVGQNEGRVNNAQVKLDQPA